MKRNGDRRSRTLNPRARPPTGCATRRICSPARSSSLPPAKSTQWRTRPAAFRRRSGSRPSASTSSPASRAIRLRADSSSTRRRQASISRVRHGAHARARSTGRQRQQLSNDLVAFAEEPSRRRARDGAQQPGVAQKLRDALTEMDDSDLDNHVQRTADWLRSGINPNSNGTESEIAQGLQN